MSKKQNSPSKFKKIFTKANITKVMLPSLALALIILSPVAFEVFRTRHQQISNVIEAPAPDNWIYDIFAPTQDIDPDTNESQGILDGFTNGVTDPERLLFTVTPADEYFYWRYEVYDEYTMDNWDKDLNTVNYNGYSSLPSNADGEFTVTTDLVYSGGTFTGNFPAPSHYLYGEEFSNAFSFSPSENYIPSESSLEEDIYGAISIDASFENQIDNTTLTYPVAYTIQNNSYIEENSNGFSTLNSLISSNSELNTRYLQLPNNYVAAAPLTNQIATDLLNPSDTIYEQVFRNMVWLTKNNTYDVDMLMGLSDEEPAEGEDYVEWFLNRRMGTAGHFSASLAIICRLQNIPSRMVVGFSYGDQIGNEFIIRAKHIHSWVEVFIPFDSSTGYWIAFDPSPLIPGLRDQYGVNTIGFQAVFHCSNEFYLDPQHMLRQPSAPYFVPNPLSTAWQTSPYDSSVTYGPYVNRGESFNIYAYLGNGYEEDFLQYLLTGDPGSLLPIEGELVEFIDITTGTSLGTSYTDAQGYATLNYTYPIDAASGEHRIVADWIGIIAPTYDLRYIPGSYVESGVIVAGSANISSIDTLIVGQASFEVDSIPEIPNTGFFYSETTYSIINFYKKSKLVI